GGGGGGGGGGGRGAAATAVTLRFRLAAVVSLCDSPDGPGVRDLDERGIGRILERGIGIAVTEVANGPIVDQIERSVRSKEDVCRPVDGAELVCKGLVTGELRAGQLVGILLASGRAVRQVGLVSLWAVEYQARELER